ncbi:MAG: hypothetical protein ABI543_05000 [Ignavibacteria bacterium]
MLNQQKSKSLRSIRIFSFLAVVVCFISGTNTLYSQSFREVNFPDGSIAGMESIVNTHANYRIYQSAPNAIKFELPAVSLVRVGIYDSNKNLVRTYAYNNLKAGTYEISINSENIQKGKYTCVLSTADAEETSQVVIE